MARRRKNTDSLAYRLTHKTPATNTTQAKNKPQAKNNAPHGKTAKKMSSRQVFSIVLMLAALALLCYPIVATNHNNQRLSDLSESYKDKVSVKPHSDANGEELKKAEEYNEWLEKNPFTPPPIGHDKEHKDYAKYDNILSQPDGTMGTLTIPAANIDLPIYHGTSDEVLNKGAGHVYGTYLPIGGKHRTAALGAHAGMVNASMFDNLPKLKEGDLAIVQVRNKKLAYKMVSSKVHHPDDRNAIPFDDRDLLVLITCIPYGINSDRLVVTMERTELPADPQNTDNKIRTWQWWMTCVIIIAVFVLIIFVVSLYREIKRNRG